jgi:PAS domain S-box-containing protein
VEHLSIRAITGRLMAAASVRSMNTKKKPEQTDALLASIVASSMDAVFSIDVNARIQTWNKAAERLYGYTADEAIGQSLGLLVPDPEYAPGELFRRALSGEQIYFEQFRRRKNGTVIEVGISSGPIRDSHGRIVGLSVVHRDISERQRAERELRQTQEWLELTQEAGRVGPWEYEIPSGEMRWSRELYRQLGHDPARVAPSLAAFRDRVHPDDHARLDWIRAQERTADAGAQFQMELRVILPDGSLSWFDRRSRIVPEDGRRRIIGCNVDIAERKKQEENLRFIMGELSHRTKNILSVVQAMASQTARHTESFDDFQERFLGRIGALSQSHDLLVSQNWRGASLLDLILTQLRPFVDDQARLQTEGPPVFLKAAATQALGIMLHELATNASKYGALSVPGGRIRIQWQLTDASIAVGWREYDGPLVKAPIRNGFGRILVERMARDMFGITPRLELLPTGARWSATIPLSLIAL